jgi:hypothetical protein
MKRMKEAHMNETRRGSVFAYILAAIFLMGVLIVSLTGGPGKSAVTGQLDELVTLLQSDISQISAAVSDCTLNYSAPVDFDADGKTCSDSVTGTCSGAAIDNPNPPFPLYNSTWSALTSYGSTAVALTSITCPGAPGMPKLFDTSTMKASRALRLLSNTTTYTTTYLNDSTEGVMLSITRTSSDPLWTEAVSRINAKNSTCKAAVVTAAGPCANGCLDIWLLRRTATTVIGTTGTEAACHP